MGTLPADVRRKKVLSYCRLFFQTPDMESQVARCMALQFPTVLSQVSAGPISPLFCCLYIDDACLAGLEVPAGRVH